MQTLKTQVRRLLHRQKRWVNKASEVNKTLLLLLLDIHFNTTSAQDSKQIIVESNHFCPDINTQIQNLFMYVSPALKEKLIAFEVYKIPVPFLVKFWPWFWTISVVRYYSQTFIKALLLKSTWKSKSTFFTFCGTWWSLLLYYSSKYNNLCYDSWRTS